MVAEAYMAKSSDNTILHEIVCELASHKILYFHVLRKAHECGWKRLTQMFEVLFVEEEIDAGEIFFLRIR